MSTHLTAAATQLEHALEDPDLVEGDRAELAARLAQIQHAKNLIASCSASVEKFLADLMETDEEVCGDHLARRRWYQPGGWLMDDVRHAVRPAVTIRACTDPTTGEVHDEALPYVEAAYDLTLATYTITPKAGSRDKGGGLRGLNLNPNLYRKDSAGMGRWNVHVEPAHRTTASGEVEAA
jgi:hypothetical protein